MIIVGYQGIGKSTLAHQREDVIDLESGCFWINGKRHPDWYIAYCQMAEYLSQQGYCVFVSSHEVVRKYLIEHSEEYCAAIYPGEELEQEWIAKLQERYEASGLDKDYKAWKNAEDRFLDNIKEIHIDFGENSWVIPTMDYDLDGIVNRLFNEELDFHRCKELTQMRKDDLRKFQQTEK